MLAVSLCIFHSINWIHRNKCGDLYFTCFEVGFNGN